jgi:hypothetical protein
MLNVFGSYKCLLLIQRLDGLRSRIRLIFHKTKRYAKETHHDVVSEDPDDDRTLTVVAVGGVILLSLAATIAIIGWLPDAGRQLPAPIPGGAARASASPTLALDAPEQSAEA